MTTRKLTDYKHLFVSFLSPGDGCTPAALRELRCHKFTRSQRPLKRRNVPRHTRGTLNTSNGSTGSATPRLAHSHLTFGWSRRLSRTAETRTRSPTATPPTASGTARLAMDDGRWTMDDGRRATNGARGKKKKRPINNEIGELHMHTHTRTHDVRQDTKQNTQRGTHGPREPRVRAEWPTRAARAECEPAHATGTLYALPC